MTTIWERTATALTTLALPIAANRMIAASGQPLPDLYLVYQLITSPPEAHADNAEILRSYRMQVTAYSRSGLAGLPDIDAAMTAAGFMPSYKRELPYSETTRHYGLVQEYVYLEQKE
jgi:hypothetical protein